MKKVFIRSILSIFFGATINTVVAQYTNIMVDSASSPQEPSIAINPLNTKQMAVGANWDYAFYSSDSGMSWQASSGISSSIVDPCMKADSLGNIFYFHLINGQYGAYCQQSTNEGVSFLSATKAWTGSNIPPDKDWAYIDPHTNNLYVTWTQYDNPFHPGPTDSSRIYFSKSVDNGATFSLGVRLDRYAGDCLDLDITDPHPSVGPNGEIYVTFMDSVGIRYNKSVDYGNTWLPTQPVIDSNGSYRYDSIQYVNRIRTMPYSDCDRSNSPYRGNIYLCWADQRNGKNNSDIFFCKSSNSGATWSTPLKVNSDNSHLQQYRPAMTIDQTNGYIYIVFYDRRNYRNNDSTDVYMAKSVNGGTTWTDFKISANGFINKNDIFDGDYIDISTVAGMIRPVWTRVDGNNSSIWTCLCNEPGLGVPQLITTKEQWIVFPNPSRGLFTFQPESEKSKVKNIEIYNVFGDKFYTQCITHKQLTVDLRDKPNGVYFYKIVAADEALLSQGKLLIAK